MSKATSREDGRNGDGLVRTKIRSTLATCLTALTVATAGIVAVVAPASPAQAYALLDCKFAQPTPLYVQRQYTARDWYWARSREAFIRWNSANTATSFGVTTDRPGNVVIGETIFADTTIKAQQTGTCGSGGVWAGHAVNINWKSGLHNEVSHNVGRLVGSHEFGHALGLAHTFPSCTGTKSVMVEGSNKWACGWGLEPWADDIAGINYLY